jgi:hypothetical protein
MEIPQTNAADVTLSVAKGLGWGKCPSSDASVAPTEWGLPQHDMVLGFAKCNFLDFTN